MAGKKSLRSRLPALAGMLFMVLFTLAVIWLVRDFISNAEPPDKTRVQKISLVKPPPPKPQEKPPEPEKIEQEQTRQDEVQLDAPPTPDQPQDEGPPPGEQLGLDADGGAGSDGFGLAARKGGRDITTLGGGGSGDRMAWFSKRISRQLEDSLKRAKSLQGKEYQVVAQLWFDIGGGVTRVLMDRGSGNTELDETLRRELLAMTLHDPLPEDLPQPVKLRVVSR